MIRPKGEIITVVNRNIKAETWRKFRTISIYKGSTVSYCLNSALEEYVMKHKTDYILSMRILIGSIP